MAPVRKGGKGSPVRIGKRRLQAADTLKKNKKPRSKSHEEKSVEMVRAFRLACAPLLGKVHKPRGGPMDPTRVATVMSISTDGTQATVTLDRLPAAEAGGPEHLRMTTAFGEAGCFPRDARVPKNRKGFAQAAQAEEDGEVMHVSDDEDVEDVIEDVPAPQQRARPSRRREIAPPTPEVGNGQLEQQWEDEESSAPAPSRTRSGAAAARAARASRRLGGRMRADRETTPRQQSGSESGRQQPVASGSGTTGPRAARSEISDDFLRSLDQLGVNSVKDADARSDSTRISTRSQPVFSNSA